MHIPAFRNYLEIDTLYFHSMDKIEPHQVRYATLYILFLATNFETQLPIFSPFITTSCDPVIQHCN